MTMNTPKTQLPGETAVASSDVLSSVRWLLNKSEEKPKAYVGPLLDKNCDVNGVTIRQQLESLFEERTEGRRKQSERVMPLIGGLLDAWDGLSNDLKGDDELSTLRSYLERIEAAMEDNAPGERIAADKSKL